MIKIQNVKGGIDMFITGVIGWDVRADEVIRELNFYKDSAINMHIFSEGGLVFDALAIYDFIKGAGIDVTAYGSGLVGSAATIIMSAANDKQLGENSFYFIHNASGGDNEETLAKINERIVAIYKDLTGLKKNELNKLLSEGDNGAILNATEAKKLGFVDKVFKENAMAADMPEIVDNKISQEYLNKLKELNSKKMEENTPKPTEKVTLTWLERLTGEAAIEIDAELKTQIDNITTDFNDLKKEKEDLEATVAEFEAVKTEHESAMSEKATEIENLKTEKESLTSQITEKDSEIENLKKEIEDLKKEPVAEPTTTNADSQEETKEFTTAQRWARINENINKKIK